MRTTTITSLSRSETGSGKVTLVANPALGCTSRLGHWLCEKAGEKNDERIELTPRLSNLFTTAINSDDLTVRVAGIEVELAARNLKKTPAMVDEQARIFDILMASLHDENENIRYWAVEGLAFLAVDASIEPLLDMFHNDPSPTIRERAACGLAQSGMFSAAQRRKAVPTLLDFADDGTLDGQTRSWVYQALRDITGQSLPRDANAWRTWYAASSTR